MSQPPAIQIDNLAIRYDGKTLLSDFSLRLESGQKVTLSGRSGSGKSTVLRCILGFVIPDEGAIYINGERLTGSSVWTLRQQIAYVAQEPLLGSGSVREILERPFTYRANAKKRENLSRIPELFDRFTLPGDLIHKNIELLSGGEKQRVAIISAELLDRRIFLLDEASSALDRISKQAVNEFFCDRRDLSVLSVSHEPEQFFCTDRIFELSPGSGGDVR